MCERETERERDTRRGACVQVCIVVASVHLLCMSRLCIVTYYPVTHCFPVLSFPHLLSETGGVPQVASEPVWRRWRSCNSLATKLQMQQHLSDPHWDEEDFCDHGCKERRGCLPHLPGAEPFWEGNEGARMIVPLCCKRDQDFEVEV